MKQYLRYGDGSAEVELPDGHVDIISKPQKMHEGGESLILQALENASPSLQDFLGQGKSVVIVASDQTRDTGSAFYLPVILDLAKRQARQVTIIIALGLHRPATDSEIQTILGCDPGRNVRIVNHDPDANLLDFGDTRFAASVVEADRIILTGSVTFHPMAGYSGGWKSLLPGVASRQATIENHKLYFSGDLTDPRVGSARVENNPVLEDIRKRTRVFADKTWCLNVVQDESKAIVHAAAGSVDKAWRSCTAYLDEYNSFNLGRRYPVVVASSGGYPSDFSFYQSMKTITNASQACTKGGSIYLIMECRNGWELDRNVLSLAELELPLIASKVRQDFSMSGLAVYMALSMMRDYKVYCLSALPDNEVRAFGMRPLSSVSDIGSFVAQEGADRIAVMPAAATLLPRISKD